MIKKVITALSCAALFHTALYAVDNDAELKGNQEQGASFQQVPVTNIIESAFARAYYLTSVAGSGSQDSAITSVLSNILTEENGWQETTLNFDIEESNLDGEKNTYFNGLKRCSANYAQIIESDEKNKNTLENINHQFLCQNQIKECQDSIKRLTDRIPQVKKEHNDLKEKIKNWLTVCVKYKYKVIDDKTTIQLLSLWHGDESITRKNCILDHENPNLSKLALEKIIAQFSEKDLCVSGVMSFQSQSKNVTGTDVGHFTYCKMARVNNKWTTQVYDSCLDPEGLQNTAKIVDYLTLGKLAVARKLVHFAHVKENVINWLISLHKDSRVSYCFTGFQGKINHHDCGRFSAVFAGYDTLSDVLPTELTSLDMYYGFKTLEKEKYEQYNKTQQSWFSWFMGSVRNPVDLYFYLFGRKESTHQKLA